MEPQRRSDEETARDVARVLADHQALQGVEITPRVEDGRVTLSGVVGAWRQARDAARLARAVTGVDEVRDALVVSPDEGERRSDDELTAGAAEALKGCLGLAGSDISARVEAGVLTLEGTAPYPSQRYDAELAVERLGGLRRVKNLIRVAARERVDLERAHQIVARTLKRHAAHEAQALVLTANGGTLRVAGKLASEEERRGVLAALRGAPGVHQLIDEITLAEAGTA